MLSVQYIGIWRIAVAPIVAPTIAKTIVPVGNSLLTALPRSLSVCRQVES
jgi:hypothetical protein